MKKNSILLSLLFVSFLIVDLIGYSIWGNSYIFMNKKTVIDFGYFVFLFFALFLSRFRFLIVGLFFLALTDLGHFYLFKVHLLPYEWKLFFMSYHDVLNALVNNLFVLTLLMSALVLFTLTLFFSKRKTYIIADFVVIFLLLFPFFQTKKITTFLPSNKHMTYFNALFSLDRELYMLFHAPKAKHFLPYRYKKLQSSKPLVVLVIGESLNYKRMHLYGWPFKDTPKLDSLKKDPDFVYKKAISASTETLTSIGSFLYNKREPQNIGVLNQPNIIELAKKNGYKVYWLSMQLDRGALLPKFYLSTDVHYIRGDFKRKYDDELLKKLKNIPLAKKSFVIIHLRANHYYYEDYTPKKYYHWNISDKSNYHTYMVNSYMDSVLYVDTLLYDMIEYFKHLDRKFVFYFTSDHSERLGFKDEGGKYLHLELDKCVSYVPFFYYSKSYKRNLTDKYYSHYQISKMVTEDLGYDLINPNEKKNIYYINAPQFDGVAGYIKYDISKWKDR